MAMPIKDLECLPTYIPEFELCPHIWDVAIKIK
jgi:hypothetical protein